MPPVTHRRVFRPPNHFSYQKKIFFLWVSEPFLVMEREIFPVPFLRRLTIIFVIPSPSAERIGPFVHKEVFFFPNCVPVSDLRYFFVSLLLLGSFCPPYDLSSHKIPFSFYFALDSPPTTRLPPINTLSALPFPVVLGCAPPGERHESVLTGSVPPLFQPRLTLILFLVRP